MENIKKYFPYVTFAYSFKDDNCEVGKIIILASNVKASQGDIFNFFGMYCE